MISSSVSARMIGSKRWIQYVSVSLVCVSAFNMPSVIMKIRSWGAYISGSSGLLVKVAASSRVSHAIETMTKFARTSRT